MNKYTFYWFDHLFDADKHTIDKAEYGMSARENDTIEDVQRKQFREEEILAEPQDFMEAYRNKHLTQTPF